MTGLHPRTWRDWLADPGVPVVTSQHSGSTVEVVHAKIGGISTVVARTGDGPDRAALGVNEFAHLEGALAEAVGAGCPLILLVDSAGVRVTEGLPVVAAYRRFARALLDRRAAGLRTIAVVAQAYGAASLLSAWCDRLFAWPEAPISMSGPRLLRGDSSLPALMQDRALLTAAARCSNGIQINLLPPRPAAARDAISAALLREKTTVGADTDLPRLGTPPAHAAPVSSMLSFLLARLAVDARLQTVRNGILEAAGRDSLGAFAIVGIVGGIDTGAEHADAAFEAVRAARARGGHRLVFVLETPSHAASWVDEARHLTWRIARLALELDATRRSGTPISLVCAGGVGGGIAAALIPVATEVVGIPGALYRLLPSSALSALGVAPEDSSPAPDAHGVFDVWLQSEHEHTPL